MRPDPDMLATLARQLADDGDLDALLRRVVDASVAQIDGAEHAGITVFSGGSVTTPAATDDFVRDVDKRQYAVGQGPCLTAAIEHQPMVRVADLHTDPRWPEFSAAVADMGVRAALCFQLYTSTDTIGALNTYASTPGAFTDESVHTGMLLATHAAVAAVAAARSGNLRTALQSRDTIGQAKGILMERYKITADQAFDLLITASQRGHRKLRDVADTLAATGDLSLD